MSFARCGFAPFVRTTAAVLAAFLLLSGCTASTSDDGLGNRNDSDGAEGLDDGATIALSDSPGKLLVIDEHEGLGSTNVYGELDSSTTEARITGFDVDAGDLTATVTVGDGNKPTEVSIGSTTLTLNYLADDSVNFQLHHLGELVVEGNSLDEARAKTVASSSEWAPVVESDVFECVAQRIAEWALIVVRRYRPAWTGTSGAGLPLTECMEANDAVVDLAWTQCIMINSLQRRLNAALQLREEDREGPVALILSELYSIVPLVLVGTEEGATRVGETLWTNPACSEEQERPGCTDTCQWALDDVCDDGGPGSSNASCELGTDCTDCGPRESGDDSNDNTNDNSQDAVCGDGICDRAADEPNRCPADCPADCGDGICNVDAGEPTSCPQDCPEESCCVSTNGCPSEELYACPGECCCCPSGARCVQSSGRWICGI